MKKIISAKRQKIGGQEFIVGEEIPVGIIESNRFPALLKLGCIKTVDAPEKPKAEVTVTDKVPPVTETTEAKPAKATSKKKASK